MCNRDLTYVFYTLLKICFERKIQRKKEKLLRKSSRIAYARKYACTCANCAVAFDLWTNEVARRRVR